MKVATVTDVPSGKSPIDRVGATVVLYRVCYSSCLEVVMLNRMVLLEFSRSYLNHGLDVVAPDCHYSLPNIPGLPSFSKVQTLEAHHLTRVLLELPHKDRTQMK